MGSTRGPHGAQTPAYLAGLVTLVCRTKGVQSQLAAGARVHSLPDPPAAQVPGRLRSRTRRIHMSWRASTPSLIRGQCRTPRERSCETPGRPPSRGDEAGSPNAATRAVARMAIGSPLSPRCCGHACPWMAVLRRGLPSVRRIVNLTSHTLCERNERSGQAAFRCRARSTYLLELTVAGLSR